MTFVAPSRTAPKWPPRWASVCGSHLRVTPTSVNGGQLHALRELPLMGLPGVTSRLVGTDHSRSTVSSPSTYTPRGLSKHARSRSSSRRPKAAPRVSVTSRHLEINRCGAGARRFRAVLPAEAGAPVRPAEVATPAAHTALVVSHDFSGSIRASRCGFVASRSRSWGSHGFGVARPGFVRLEEIKLLNARCLFLRHVPHVPYCPSKLSPCMQPSALQPDSHPIRSR